MALNHAAPSFSSSGIVWSKAIQEHIYGTSNLDIRKAKRLLEDHEVNCMKPIKENVTFIEEAIIVVFVATALHCTALYCTDCPCCHL